MYRDPHLKLDVLLEAIDRLESIAGHPYELISAEMFDELYADAADRVV